MDSEQEAIYQAAIAWLERSSLSADLKARAIAIVPGLPTRHEGMPYCRGCESVLCGACGDCHSLDLAPPDLCPADQDTMGSDCAAWFQAYNAVFTMAREIEEAEQ
jgi:hypothetical protein